MNLALDSRIGWEGIRSIACCSLRGHGCDALSRPSLSTKSAETEYFTA